MKGKKMVVITSRGGDYTSQERRAYDMQEPYPRTIFGFVGLTDMTFVNAQPMNMGSELENKGVAEAQAVARNVAEGF